MDEVQISYVKTIEGDRQAVYFVVCVGLFTE